MNLNKSSLVALILASIGLNALAQSKNDEPKGDKKISLMIVTEEDGQKTIIDTTFTTADEETMRNYLKSRGVKDFDMSLPPLPPPPPPAPGTPPPPPPAPGDDREVAYQYEYRINDHKKGKHRDDKEIHVVVDNKELDAAIDEAKKQLESSLKKTSKLTKEEINKITEEFDENMKDLKSKAKEEKKVIIIETDKKKIDK
jgi:type IV secretory pathway VirB10-like protein